MAQSRKDARFATQQVGTNQDLQQLVAKKAYELYEQSGRVEGRDLEHWLEAERLVRAQSGVRN
ncbi:MAG: DUF2934 domain-containing protein [Candidatus Omnitrophica bacterium]|nr:DUF2934 domain-containing protein [Candidatus Omnitrophota bacterium]